jgi:hypothetical protein
MRNVNSRPSRGNGHREKTVRSGLDAAMERDRRFFARHPFLPEYTREIMPGEFPAWATPPGCEAYGRVIVRQIAPGLRLRLIHPDYFVVNVEQAR